MEIIQKVSKGIVLNGTFFMINATFQQESEISLQLCNGKRLLKTYYLNSLQEWNFFVPTFAINESKN